MLGYANSLKLSKFNLRCMVSFDNGMIVGVIFAYLIMVNLPQERSMQVGDRVVIWETGTDAGVRGLATVTQAPIQKIPERPELFKIDMSIRSTKSRPQILDVLPACLILKEGGHHLR